MKFWRWKGVRWAPKSTMKDHDPDLLIFLVPFLYREFPKILINNQEVISSIISCINPRGVYCLQVCHCYEITIQLFVYHLFYFSLDYEMVNSKCSRIIKVGQHWKKSSRKVLSAFAQVCKVITSKVCKDFPRKSANTFATKVWLVSAG